MKASQQYPSQWLTVKLVQLLLVALGVGGTQLSAQLAGSGAKGLIGLRRDEQQIWSCLVGCCHLTEFEVAEERGFISAGCQVMSLQRAVELV